VLRKVDFDFTTAFSAPDIHYDLGIVDAAIAAGRVTRCNRMDERLRFVVRLLDGEKMAFAWREFGISRKTGYKVFARVKFRPLGNCPVFTGPVYRNLRLMRAANDSNGRIAAADNASFEYALDIAVARSLTNSCTRRRGY
jgi:hypothetical protein